MRAALTFETLAILYFAALAAAAPFTRAPAGRRAVVMLAAVLLAAAVASVRSVALDVRLWLGHGYLIAGYWLPGLLASIPNRFEAWLVRADARLLAARHMPRFGADWVWELAYLMCYPLVPAAFLLIWRAGTVEDVNRFWTAVLGAGFVCYASVPWLVARPPRDVPPTPESDSAGPGVRRINVFVLRRVSHGFTTFPSGHVAVAVAAALISMPITRAGGAVLTVIAIGIAIGAVAGRYHFAVDVALGIAVGVIAALLA